MGKHIVAVLVALLFTVSAQAQIKIGFMNPAEVLAQIEEVQIIEQEIQKLVETRDADLLARTTQLQQDFATYEEGKTVLSEQARAEKEQEFLDRNEALEQDRETYLNEIRQKRAQMMTPIIERMDTAIKVTAEEMGLDLVLNQMTSYGDAIIFFSKEERLNITSLVLAKLQAQ
ncbi:MAG: OmpH family outer membrane protein [Balneola sp.]|nr:MAG: OmpH family outer membrane protein [Balneola sp.]